MKKAIFAVAALLCLGLASCSKDCTCTTVIAGEVVGTVTVKESTLQAAGTTCEKYNEILLLTASISGDPKEYSVTCK